MYRQKGQTLIEVLTALSIAVVLLFGITIAVISSLNNAQFSKNQNLANHYAEQGMEIVRNIWNSDLATFNALTGNYCLDKNSMTLTVRDPTIQGCSSSGTNPAGTNIDNSFARGIDILKNSSDCAPTGVSSPTPTPQPSATKVTVKVSWTDSKCTDRSNIFCHKVELVSCLSKIYTLQAP